MHPPSLWQRLELLQQQLEDDDILLLLFVAVVVSTVVVLLAGGISPVVALADELPQPIAIEYYVTHSHSLACVSE